MAKTARISSPRSEPAKTPIRPGGSLRPVRGSRSSPTRKSLRAKAAVPHRQVELAGGKQPRTFPIVGIGASAGGLGAFTGFFEHLPADTGMAFVLVQHLDPTHESILTDILSKTTALPVREVENNMPLEPNHVYVIRPNTKMTVAGGVLKLVEAKRESGAQHSIDHFLESL